MGNCAPALHGLEEISMFLGPRLTSFVQDFSAVNDALSLKSLLDDVTRSLGFEQFALVCHVDFSHPPGGAMVLISYDEDWIQRALSRRYYVDDPIHAASTRTLTSFLWRDVPDMLPLSPRQRRILEEARAFGLCEGLTVPAHSPGRHRGTCSFASRRFDEVTPHQLGAAHLIGTFAFEAARRVVWSCWSDQGQVSFLPSLSQRQLDCLALVAGGKSDCEIAHRLGLSEPTVHQHILAAMRRYGVTKRTQLVVRALFDGQICFRETLLR